MTHDKYVVVIDDPMYKPAHKLEGMTAIVTGGDSGIGAATAICLAKEGAKVVIQYLDEDKDAERVKDIIIGYGGTALCIQGDLTSETVCKRVVKETLDSFDKIDILINNAGTQTPQEALTNISTEQLHETFKTNFYSAVFLTQVALPHLHSGSSILFTTSVTAYRGSDELLDYSATKGALTSFVRSLSLNLAPKNIRVNAVAPGPVWTPLVLDSFDDQKLAEFGHKQPLGYAAQPIEIAPAYCFLASRDARYVTGQVMHVNGGEIINT